MKEIKIFIASSSELEIERKEIALEIFKQNQFYKQYNIEFKPVLWEYLLLDFGKNRKQDDLNEKLLQCQIAIFLFNKKVGNFTKEEFDLAIENMRSGYKPKLVFVYFKNFQLLLDEINEEITKLKEFKEQIKNLEGYYDNFENKDILLSKIKNQLQLFVDEYIIPKKKQ